MLVTVSPIVRKATAASGIISTWTAKLFGSDEHCKRIIEELEKRNVDPEMIHAIASHGPRYFGVEPVIKMDKMLYAFDELSGLIHAYSLMRPNGYEGMELKGVMKRFKEKTFAANVSRDDIRDACERAGIALDVLIIFIIKHQN